MARSIDQINKYIISSLVTNMAVIGISIDPTTWSKRNFFRLICYTVAISTGLLEQLIDLFTQQIETIVATASAASPLWVQQKMFQFQYSATNPQVISLINVVPVYSVIDTTLQIITACSVNSNSSNNVAVKVAKGNPLVPLTSTERDSAQGYINTIGVMGIEYDVISLNSDKIFIDATIYFSGQYSAIIQTSVINALLAFLQNLSLTNFNGSLKMTDLESIIRNTLGVNDVVLNNVRGREDTAVFAAGIDFILNTAIIQRKWNTVSGYIGQETTTGKTFTDSLVFIAE
jgi:hypothetical protein